MQQIGSAAKKKKTNGRKAEKERSQRHQSVVAAAESFLAEAQKELLTVNNKS